MTELDTATIQAGDSWQRPNESRAICIEYVEHINDEPMYILSLWPTWSLSYGWHGAGLCHWGRTDDGGWTYLMTRKQTRKALMKSGYTERVKDYHICVMRNDEEKPPEICRSLFGRMAECHEEAGINPEPFKTLATR